MHALERAGAGAASGRVLPLDDGARRARRRLLADRHTGAGRRRPRRRRSLVARDRRKPDRPERRLPAHRRVRRGVRAGSALPRRRGHRVPRAPPRGGVVGRLRAVGGRVPRDEDAPGATQAALSVRVRHGRARREGRASPQATARDRLPPDAGAGHGRCHSGSLGAATGRAAALRRRVHGGIRRGYCRSRSAGKRITSRIESCP